MRIPHSLVAIVVTLGIVTSSNVVGQTLTETQAVQITKDVRAYAHTVADDVSEKGPRAWRLHFAETPSFFMAAEGRLVFPNSAAASTAIDELERRIKKIILRWGDDVRVDPLAPNLAVLAAAYHETRVSVAGQRVEEDGYFTGVAEYRSGRWQLRDAHWSVAVPRSPVP